MPRPEVNLAYLTSAGVDDGQPAPEVITASDRRDMSPDGDTPPTDGFHLQSLAGQQQQQPSPAPVSRRRPAFTAQMLRTARRSPQRRRPWPSPRRQRTEPSFRRMGWPSLCVFVVPANGTRRIPQYSTACLERLDLLQDMDMELCRPGGAQASGGGVLLVSGPWGWCVWRTGPPSKKKDFGHSGIFLNNTSPDPDASLPNPALQRLFDLRVFSSRANENAPANMEVLPSGLASSQHAHLFLLLLLLLLLFVVTELPLPPPTSTSLKVPKSRYSACCSASRRLPWLVSHVSSRSAFSWMAMLDPQPIPLLI